MELKVEETIREFVREAEKSYFDWANFFLNNAIIRI